MASTTIVFGADISGLIAGTDVAKRELSALNGEVRKISTEFLESGKASKALADQLTTLAGKKAALQSQVSAGAAALKSYNNDLGGVGKSAGLASYELQNLSRQGQDVFVMLSGGQGVMATLITQGPQIFDVLSSSSLGFKGALSSLLGTVGGFVTSFGGIATLGATALGGIGYAFYGAATAAKETELAIDGVIAKLALAGQSSGLVSMAASVRKEIAELTKDDRNIWQRWAPEFAGGKDSPALDGKDANALAGTVGNDAARDWLSGLRDSLYNAGIRGEDLTATLKQMAQALAEPGKYIEQQIQGFKTLSDVERAHYESISKTGTATEKLVAAMELQGRAAEEALAKNSANSGIGEEFQRLAESILKAYQATGDLDAVLGSLDRQDRARYESSAALQKIVGDVVKEIDRERDARNKAIDAVKKAADIEKEKADAAQRLADKLQPEKAKRQELESQIQQLTTALDAESAKHGDTSAAAQNLATALGVLQGKLLELTSTAGGEGAGGKAGNANAGEHGWWTADRQKHAFDRLTQEAGLSEQGALGLVSRWKNVEASGGPGSTNEIGAFGIAQWLGSRKTGIAGNTDFDAQLSHAIKELGTTETKAAAILRNAKTPAEGAIGASTFERAEGFNPSTGRDNFTAKTLAGMGGIATEQKAIDADRVKAEDARHEKAVANLRKELAESDTAEKKRGVQGKIDAENKDYAKAKGDPNADTNYQTSRVTAERQANAQILQDRLRTLQQTYQVQRNSLQNEQQVAVARAQAEGQTQQQIAQVKAAHLSRMQQLEQGYYLQKGTLLAGDKQGFESNESQKTIALQNAIAQRKQLEIQSNATSKNGFQQMADGMASSLGGAITGMIMGTTKFRDAMRNIASQVLNMFITNGLKMLMNQLFVNQAGVAQTLAGEAQKTAVVTAGETTRTGVVTAGAAARATAEQTAGSTGLIGILGNILKAIAGSVGQVFAGVSAFLAPLLGPAAPGVAAGVAGAVQGTAVGLAGFASGSFGLGGDGPIYAHAGEFIVPQKDSAKFRAILGGMGISGLGGFSDWISKTPAYAAGAWELNTNHLAQVHAGEMIVPSGPAKAWRSDLEGGASGAGKGVTVNHSTNLNISAIDGASVKNWFKNNEKLLLQTVNAGVRKGAHLGMNRFGQ